MKLNMVIIILSIVGLCILCNYFQNKKIDTFITTTSSSNMEIKIPSDKTSKDILLSLNNYKFNLNKPFEKKLLKNLNTNERSILRNSIFAKYGYTFSTQKYTDYFSQFPWYFQTNTDVKEKLNDIDKQNINLIRMLEKNIDLLQFKSNKLGFSLTFPESWRDKYRIEEYDMGITVYFNPNEKLDNKCGEFFSIINIKSPDLNTDLYDSIGNILYFEVNDSKYFIGGPTDVAFPEDHPESDVFRKMNLDIEKILSTLKQL